MTPSATPPSTASITSKIVISEAGAGEPEPAAAMIAARAETDGVAPIAPLLLQPIAPADVAEILARIAVGEPQGRHRDIAGPGTEDMVDMARRTHAVQGRDVRLVPTWHNGVFTSEMADDVMLPGPDAEIAPTSFEAWLATQAA